MDWKQLLAYITGSVDQALLLRNEYVITENRILRQQIPGRVRLGDEERKALAEIGQKLGKQALAEVATSVLQLRHIADYQQPGVSRPQAERAVRRAREFITLLQGEVFDGP